MIAVSDGIHQELVFLLISFALGEGLVMLYDVFRIFRKVVPHGVIWISVEDVLYWIVAALLIFGMIFQENDGLIRGFAIGGILLGMLFFNHFVSPFLIRSISGILKKILEILKKGLKKVREAVKIGLCKLGLGE
ncbi:MAG: spore cortex biosynthesis protein YabQ [Lachnospiraceae bacterium]|nr:spore cortex biosynthesis protein YabQ [Lachnospiraceae bacterium]